MAIADATQAFALTRDQVNQYVDQGYLVVEDLINPSEIAALKADILKLARGGYPCPKLEALPADIDDDQALREILCIHHPHRVSPVIRSFCEHPKIVAVLTKVVAAHLPAAWWDGSVKCMQSMFFAKGPGKPGKIAKNARCFY